MSENVKRARLALRHQLGAGDVERVAAALDEAEARGRESARMPLLALVDEYDRQRWCEITVGDVLNALGIGGAA